MRVHYEARGRLEATRGLVASIESAWQQIITNPAAGLLAPRPDPKIARHGRLWVDAGRYWLAYVTRPSLAIVAVVYDAADIPRRL